MIALQNQEVFYLIDSYIILNRKSSPTIKIFLFIIITLIFIVIWALNTLNINSIIHINSEIHNVHSYYLMKVIVPQKEVNNITNKKLLINGKIYKFNIYQKSPNIIYKNNNNYRELYLKIYNLDKEYQVNGYHINITLVGESKRILDYLKKGE